MRLFCFVCVGLLGLSCQQKKTVTISMPADSVNFLPGTFGFDRAFLSKHKEVIVLGGKNSSAKVLVVKDYQGRVMTSTSDGNLGISYGWINYRLIETHQAQAHINPVGGEDRFWLGPEGGQYSVFFKKGSAFDFEHWQTPALIDTEPFELVSSDSIQASFTKTADVTNYADFTFHVQIDRQIRFLDNRQVQERFDFASDNVKIVAFESVNSITNKGANDWTKKNGLISIWILGMMNPSYQTTIVLPHAKSVGQGQVSTNYFGTIPAERIAETENYLLLKGDGKYRGKVGIAPSIAKNVAGSYDAAKHVLTVIAYDLDQNASYVNSKWEVQKSPFKGDAVNAYNDGPLADGSQLGPFYELESSSPAKELKSGEKLTHRHTTIHIEGGHDALNEIAKKVLGVQLDEIQIKGDLRKN